MEQKLELERNVERNEGKIPAPGMWNGTSSQTSRWNWNGNWNDNLAGTTHTLVVTNQNAISSFGNTYQHLQGQKVRHIQSLSSGTLARDVAEKCSFVHPSRP